MSIPHSRKPAHEVTGAGGAYVRRRFTHGPEEVFPGHVLTAEQVAAIPRANLDALINTGKIELFPAGPGGSVGGERFAIHVGGGRYIVVEGHKITDDHVSKDEAEALVSAAGQTQQ